MQMSYTSPLQCHTILRSKYKGKGEGTCYSASYMNQTRDQKCFTISEVAADCHELMIPQRSMRPSTARVSERNDTAAQYAAIHCPRQRTTGPSVCS